MKKTTKGKKKKVRLVFSGNVNQDDLLIGSHGNTEIKVKGTFMLSGIIYCPKYSVTLDIKGAGRISFRGKCDRIIIRKISGDCTLDLTDVTCKELKCESLQGKSVVIAGNTRAITPAILSDEATLHVREGQLIFNPVVSEGARIMTINNAGVEEELNFGFQALDSYETL